MPRIMCFDYGTKRVGIAVTDNLQMIASGLCTIHPDKVEEFLHTYFKTEVVELFVVGLPKKLDNTVNEVERYIKGFIKKIQIQFPQIPIERIDERFTSSIAQQSMLQGGLGKQARQNKALVDQISATLLLQNYLNQNINKTIS
ncbi:MAG TPA: Holliday junction resolvase RuvX [Bacteroidia bacterium]|nr:Holliday junction resolvase RuvX [Bacteroidia bacterium]